MAGSKTDFHKMTMVLRQGYVDTSQNQAGGLSAAV